MAGSLIKGTLSAAPPPPQPQAPAAAPAAACSCSGGTAAPAADPDAQPDTHAAAHVPTNGMHADDACCKSADSAGGARRSRGGGAEGGAANGAPTAAASAAAASAAARRSVYHVSIMPCFDKKLEAARGDFAIPADGSATAPAAGGGEAQPWGAAADAVPETDSVLTTSEVQELMEARGVRLSDDSSAAVPLDDWWPFVAGGAADRGQGGCATAGDADAQGCCGSEGGLDGQRCCAGDEEAASEAMDVDEPAAAAGCGADSCCRTGSRRQGAGDVGGQEWRLPAVRGGSGGYLEFTVKHAAWVLYGLVRLFAGRNCLPGA